MTLACQRHNMYCLYCPYCPYCLYCLVIAVHLQAQLQYLTDLLLALPDHQDPAPSGHHQGTNTRSISGASSSFVQLQTVADAQHGVGSDSSSCCCGGSGGSSRINVTSKDLMARLLDVAQELVLIVQQLWWWLTQWADISPGEAARMMHRVRLQGQWPWPASS